MDTDSETLYASAFNQVQECGDIISSILIIYKFITEHHLPTDFNADKLRGIALRSADKDTSTYLWHINALIAASSDFEHLLLGIEMMFDRFLGNKEIFIKEKQKQKKMSKESICPSSKLCKSSKAKHKFIGNEIVSFVNSYYDESNTPTKKAQMLKESEHEQEKEIDEVTESVDILPNDSPILSSINIIKANEWKMPIIQNDENENRQNVNQNVIFSEDECNKEYMQKYRGKLSSPISFRMRQQKRMMQSGRKVKSRNAARNCSVDLNLFIEDDKERKNHLSSTTTSYYAAQQTEEPEILSPFNVTKFAKKVDAMEDDECSAQRLLQFER